MIKKRAVIAMSGGVDSSVAAGLLLEKGFEVIGLTMCFGHRDRTAKRPSCCGLEGIEDAKRVAYKLGIKHYLISMQKDLSDLVIKDFCREYLSGRTPNPCVRCNQYLKFGILLNKAKSLDAQFIATGHYARIAHQGQYLLRKAKDKNKDQSYFLYRLSQEQLKHALFPLGGYTKLQVRGLARKFKLPVAEKLGSQDICFLPGNNYRDFLRFQVKKELKPGKIVDAAGNVLGRHKGIAFYTVGQREGLGVAMGQPVYITQIMARENKIIIGAKADVYKSDFLIRRPHFIVPLKKKRVAANVKIRYNHQESPAEIRFSHSEATVYFKKPQFAITPGQSAVFYIRDTCLGGGVIDEVLG